MKDLNQRLNSLDILRGFDIFVLVCFGPLLKWASQKYACIPVCIETQFHHVKWEGFAFWDIIMPLFMFMAGAAMPFSFAKYNGSGTYIRIFRRVLMLFFLGMLVQGNLLTAKFWQTFDISILRFYSNTLQAIAVGYLISSIFLLNFKIRGQIIATLTIFILYWVLLTFCGDYTPKGNFAYYVDAIVLGKFRSASSEYTWVLSSLNFGVTVMLGVFCGHIMRRQNTKTSNAISMFVFALILLAIGYLLSFQTPIIKKIWNSSFTLWSGGLCVLLMATFYYVVDCLNFSKGINWLKIYGMNAIAAYMLYSLTKIYVFPASFEKNLPTIIVEFYTPIQCVLIFAVLYTMYKTKTFLKV